jgi:GT2 family glycosyltransferase
VSRKQGRVSKPKADLDVVIVTGGRFDMLTKCLASLYREAETSKIGVYIVDQNIPPDEYSQNRELFVEREGSKFCSFGVRHIKQDVGFPAANNDGARMGTAPLIMFLNDDVELQDGAIGKVLQTMKDETVGVCGIKLLFPPDSTSPVRPAGKVQHVGMALNIRGEPCHPLVGWSASNPKANVSRDVSFVTGACLTTRRSLFQSVGGFSPEYGLGTFEDTDLCFKVAQRGFRVYVNVEALGYHYTGSTAEKKKVAFPLGRNRVIFQTKWDGTGLMQWTEWLFL